MYIPKQYRPKDLELVLEEVREEFNNWLDSDQSKMFDQWLVLNLHAKGYRIVKVGEDGK